MIHLTFLFDFYLQYLLMKVAFSEFSLYHTIYMIDVATTKDRDSTVT